jgi:hypothetical protein
LEQFDKQIKVETWTLIWWPCRTRYQFVFFVVFSLKLDLTSEQIIEVKTWNCGLRLRFMVFNGTFNTISVISWRSVVLVEETGLVQKPGCKTETYCYVRKSPSLLIFQCYIYCYIGVSDFCTCKIVYIT